MHKNSKINANSGFTTVEILLTLAVIVLIGAVGWLVYSNSKDDTSKSTSVSKLNDSSKENRTKKDVNELKIPEFGVTLSNIPDTISDITYKTQAGTNNAYTAASFDTKALASKCGGSGWIGTVNRYPGVFSKDQENDGQLTFIKQFDGFWLGILNIGGVPCNEDPATIAFQQSQIETFKQFASNPENWKSD